MSSKVMATGAIGIVVGLLLGVVAGMFVLPPQVKTVTPSTATVTMSPTVLSPTTIERTSIVTESQTMTLTETLVKMQTAKSTVTETQTEIVEASISEEEYLEKYRVVLGYIAEMYANISEALKYAYKDSVEFCYSSGQAWLCVAFAINRVGFMVPPKGYESSHWSLIQSLHDFTDGTNFYWCWGHTNFKQGFFYDTAKSRMDQGKEYLDKSQTYLP